ncbi:MAG: hypothetical protein C4308_06410 [Chitinophagaceae bacterium]
MKKLLCIWIVMVALTAKGQENLNPVLKGNELYRKQQFELAEKEYEKALTSDKKNPVAFYNYANAIYRTGSPEKAISIFDSLAKAKVDKQLQFVANYNIGSILSKQYEDAKAANKKLDNRSDVLSAAQTALLEKSIEFYKKALRLNPNDKEARENLQKALLEMRKKNPPKKQEDQKNKQQQQKQQPKPKISPKQAEQQLKLLEQKEKQVLQKLQKNNSKTSNALPKDW